MFGGDPSLMEESKKDHMEPMDMSTSMKYKSKEARNFAKVLRNNHLKRTQKRHLSFTYTGSFAYNIYQICLRRDDTLIR